jgi:predicted MPP superfamily phosphohydrolase
LRFGFLFFPTLLFIGNLYFYHWVVRWVQPSPGWRRGIFFAMMLFIVLLPVSRVWGRHDFNLLNQKLSFLSASWIGISLFLVLAAAGSDLARFLLRQFGLTRRFRWSRTVSYRRGAAALIFLGCAAAAGYAFWEAREIGVTRIEIPLRHLPPDLDGLTIVHLSDVHYGMLHENGRLSDVVRRVNELRPDLIVFTGDLMDAAVSHMEEMAVPLSRLTAGQGVLAVIGNHEVFAGVKRAETIMRQAGIQVLRNEIKTLPGGLQVLGIDDPAVARQGLPLPDFDGLLKSLNPGKPSILLYHQPVHFEDAAAAGVGLQLSGHIHGPQLWPMVPLVRLFYSHMQGISRDGESYLYVSRGVGTGGPPMRLGSPPEIVQITLRTPK